MNPGEIVLVDWRDALSGTGEPNKRRPAVVLARGVFLVPVYRMKSSYH
ncbi:MAG TPA: hypothetical protein VIO32_00090 [Candidatus Baltobacteraceae bacterium]